MNSLDHAYPFDCPMAFALERRALLGLHCGAFAGAERCSALRFGNEPDRHGLDLPEDLL